MKFIDLRSGAPEIDDYFALNAEQLAREGKAVTLASAIQHKAGDLIDIDQIGVPLRVKRLLTQAEYLALDSENAIYPGDICWMEVEAVD